MTDDDVATETYEEAGSLAPMPTAAVEIDADEDCLYDDCDKQADYLVQIETGTTFLCCQSCSTANRIYVEENDLLEKPVKGLHDGVAGIDADADPHQFTDCPDCGGDLEYQTQTDAECQDCEALFSHEIRGDQHLLWRFTHSDGMTEVVARAE